MDIRRPPDRIRPRKGASGRATQRRSAQKRTAQERPQEDHIVFGRSRARPAGRADPASAVCNKAGACEHGRGRKRSQVATAGAGIGCIGAGLACDKRAAMLTQVRAAQGCRGSASAPESLMGAQHCRTACRPTQAQLTGRIIRTTSIEPAAAKAGFATTIAIRRRPQADWPECTCPEGVPQLSGGARTVDPFCHGWGQWVVWGSSGPSVRDCTAHLQRQPCRCGLCCYARRSRCSWLRRRGYRGHAPALHRP